MLSLWERESIRETSRVKGKCVRAFVGSSIYNDKLEQKYYRLLLGNKAYRVSEVGVTCEGWADYFVRVTLNGIDEKIPAKYLRFLNGKKITEKNNFWKY